MKRENAKKEAEQTIENNVRKRGKTVKTLVFRRRESTIQEAEKNNYRKARKKGCKESENKNKEKERKNRKGMEAEVELAF